MKKNIQVIIKENNSTIGPINSIQRVSLGYAFNYLIPQKIAEIATKNKVKHYKMLDQNKNKKENQEHLHNITLKDKFEQITKINIRKKIGKNKQIFGSIVENEIIDTIYRLTGQSISKKNLRMPIIKEIGKYQLIIVLNFKIKVNLQINILPINI